MNRHLKYKCVKVTRDGYGCSVQSGFINAFCSITQEREREDCIRVMVYLKSNKIKAIQRKSFIQKSKCFDCSGPAAACQQCMF